MAGDEYAGIFPGANHALSATDERALVKCVILAGGKGTRIAEESNTRPKPMVEIGSRPILWHIMKLYAEFGVREFIVCLGYKGYMVKEYFANYFLHQADVTFDMAGNRVEYHDCRSEPWKVTLGRYGRGHHDRRQTDAGRQVPELRASRFA
jgi:glucose-1-phosphate cytidylyltransferase